MNEEHFILLNNGVRMPLLGFGTYNLRNPERSVLEALSVGYRHIDTAQYYDNEREVGLAIQKSSIPREELFITTKTQTTGYQQTKRSIDRSLKLLGLDYVDLMLVHWPNSDNVGTYRALVEAYQTKKFRAIGVSNFNPQELDQLIKAFPVVPAVDQIETHVFWQQKRMHTYLSSKGIVHESWSPFGEGMDHIFQNPTLTDIGRAHNKTAAQVALRFLIQSDVPVIPKSDSPQRMRENFAVFDFQLSTEEMARIQKMDIKKSSSGWPHSMMEH